MTITFATTPTPAQVAAIAQAAMIAELQLTKAQELALKRHVNTPEVLAALLTAIASNYANAMQSAMAAVQAGGGR